MNNKTKGAAGEDLVLMHYQGLGYTLLERNYSFADGELDAIFTLGSDLVFVEVKVIDAIDDIDGYLHTKKLGFLKRAIENYLTQHPSTQDISLDVVFVQGNRIVELYRNVTNT